MIPSRGTDPVARDDVENVIGGNGADDLRGSAIGNVLDGGPGADTLQGRGGVDTASYATRTATQPVTIANDGQAGSGGTLDGAGDTIAEDIENLTGGAGDDSLLGNDRNNLLNGGDGADLLDGDAGAPRRGGEALPPLAVTWVRAEEELDAIRPAALAPRDEALDERALVRGVARRVPGDERHRPRRIEAVPPEEALVLGPRRPAVEEVGLGPSRDEDAIRPDAVVPAEVFLHDAVLHHVEVAVR